MNKKININGKEIEIIDMENFNINDVSDHYKKDVKTLLENLETIKQRDLCLFEKMSLIKKDQDYYLKYNNIILYYSEYRDHYNFLSLNGYYSFGAEKTPNTMKTFNIPALKKWLDFMEELDKENQKKMTEWEVERDLFIQNIEGKIGQKIKLENGYCQISNGIFKIIVRIKDYQYYTFDLKFDEYDFRQNNIDKFEKIREREQTRWYYEEQERFLDNKKLDLFKITNFIKNFN